LLNTFTIEYTSITRYLLDTLTIESQLSLDVC
jgi:hypothetical protein